MIFKPRASRRRLRLTHWRTLFREYRLKGSDLSDDELEALSRNVAREMNRYDNCLHYNDYKSEQRWELRGLRVINEDVREQEEP